ncbi:hypothetical protein GCM10023238_07180 [Streptomyces heliomycini]
MDSAAGVDAGTTGFDGCGWTRCTAMVDTRACHFMEEQSEGWNAIAADTGAGPCFMFAESELNDP